MKTFRIFIPRNMVNIWLSLCLILIGGCDKQDNQDLIVSNTSENQEEFDWVAFLEDLSFESNIIVEKENSISEAINEAKAGDVLFIEPGTYQEDLTAKAGVKLFGLTGSDGEKVNVANPGDVKITSIDDPQLLDKNKSQNKTKSNRFVKITRSEITSDIAHYQIEVRLGKRQFDVVRLHRVVRENRPFRPIRTQGSIFMIHGSSQDFDDIFLRPGVDSANEQNSSPVYMASKNIDVWGIDLAWTLIPEEVDEFSFMQDWGVARDVDHVLASMSIARLIRGLTRQGFGRMNLLGFSYGVSVAYAAAGRETQQPRFLRDIKGLIAADGLVKYAPEDEAFRIAACNRAIATKAEIDSGLYQNENGKTFGLFGDLAANAPNDDSPFFPGLTNYQFALFVGTVPPADPPAPFWHFVGGEFDENGIPTGLLYTNPDRWIQLLRFLAPYQPRLQGYDTSSCLCDEKETSLDAYLGEIAVPIFYLGTAGGFGQQGVYSGSLTRSQDLTHHIVAQQTPEIRAIEFGHGDLFMGRDASDLAWEKLRKWVVNHRRRVVR